MQIISMDSMRECEGIRETQGTYVESLGPVVIIISQLEDSVVDTRNDGQVHPQLVPEQSTLKGEAQQERHKRLCVCVSICVERIEH